MSVSLRMLSDHQKQTIEEILKPLEPVRIGVFGSIARGDDGPDSDIDILVKFGKKYSLFDLVEMRDMLSEALNRKIDLVTETSLHEAIRPAIEKDLIMIKR